MSPSVGVERSLPIEGRPPADYFTLNLTDGIPFDGSKFDDRVRSIGRGFSDPELAKFLVVGDVMYFFYSSVASHKRLYESLGFKDARIQCAGYVKINQPSSPQGRIIDCSNADSLSGIGLFDSEGSTEYSQRVIKPELGSHFNFIS